MDIDYEVIYDDVDSEHEIKFEVIEDDEEVMDWCSDTCVFEHQCVELMPVADDDPEGVQVAVAIDSGAVDHVSSGEDLPGIEVVPSASSKAGKHFIGANGKTIENKGQAAVSLKASNGVRINSVFQIAQVSRPFYSVSRICDAGCEVSFNRTEGRVTKNGKRIATFPRRRGLYVGN